MTDQEKFLALRRQALVRRCELQRARLIFHGDQLHGVMRVLDGTVEVVHKVRAHPGLVLGATAAVLMIVRPHRFAAALRGVISAMRTWKLVAPVVMQLRRRS